MSEDSEEACLVRAQSPQNQNPHPFGSMLYTNGPTINSSSSHPQSQHHPIHLQTQHNHPPSQSSTQRGSTQSQESDGDLIEYNDEFVLSQFHADAIKQAGCGKFQIIASIVTGLGLAGHAIQVFSVFYIVPSAEVEYCILETEKSWLASITLLGISVGAILWGGLAGKAGRRKALMSCLAVSSVFSVIAAFMPFYGPFMMARFCAAVGIGGALPTATSYLCELTPSNGRARILGLLGAFGVAGGLLAGGIATNIVPLTGQMVIVDNKEHFSSWHRYLLLLSLPTLASILGLFWLPESPRYLLENNREVEALSIYQRIYRSNRTRGGYSLTELELPATRQHRTLPISVVEEMMQSIRCFFGSFFQLYNKAYLRSTMTILAVWFTTTLAFHGMTIYISEYTKAIESTNYHRNTITKQNLNYENLTFNQSMDNIVYMNSKFSNCTFRRMFLNHVIFQNCTFTDSEFSNVKTSLTQFKASTLLTVSLIDTDLTERHFIGCNTENLTVIRMSTTCDRDFDFNIYLDALWVSNYGALVPSIILMIVMGECAHRFGKSRTATIFFLFSTVLCITFGFLVIDDQIVWVGGAAQGLMLAGLASITLLAIETYTTPLRCTAIGMFVCSGHMGAMIGGLIYSSFPVVSTKVASVFSTMIVTVPFVSSVVLKDPSVLL